MLKKRYAIGILCLLISATVVGAGLARKKTSRVSLPIQKKTEDTATPVIQITDIAPERIPETISAPIGEILEEESEIEIKADQSTLPKQVFLKVPFFSQAPFGDWKDERQQDGCEEMALIMAAYWARGEEKSAQQALADLFDTAKYEERTFGSFHDTNAEDTARLARDYFGLSARAQYDISMNDIKRELAKGNVVITPVNGKSIGNPYYTAPGPERHMVVLVGYEDKAKEFIANDPGTKRGKGYRYNYAVFWNAVRDYPSGYKTPIGDKSVKAMVVVSK